MVNIHNVEQTHKSQYEEDSLSKRKNRARDMNRQFT